MNNIKTVFSIGDLEDLSGIKAHTIRIWERRYGLLSPLRSENNLRLYGLDDLRKLLNVTLLTGCGFKISRVAQMATSDIEMMVREIKLGSHGSSSSIHLYKLSMMTFDQALFLETTDQLLAQIPFRDVFMDHYMPFLEEIGLMWQAGTIQPAHEHFISCLIRMVLLQQTAISTRKIRKGAMPGYVLFLPFGEIHEFGLMYLQYEIASKGVRSVYLGSNIPLESLADVTRLFKNAIYITYLTVLPEEKPIDQYIASLLEKVTGNDSELWVVGRRAADIPEELARGLKRFGSLKEIASNVK